MQGLDQDAMLLELSRNINAREHPAFADDLPSLLRQILETDLAYMRETGVLTPEGLQGEEAYDEDDALESILDRLSSVLNLSPDQEIDLACLLDQYFEVQRTYLEKTGLAE